ncbi:MAG: holo-ACP synthase [candidate division Zixibacteria bacterium]|jgi:holo-[acyl-carrier protein] synthase|nr:holo-ACP synthase [candidate division Zixibacteria bacterium]
MIIGIGGDIFEVSQMKKQMAKDGENLLDELFTKREQSYCRSKRYPERHLAARFAAKEAMFKALSTGKQPGYLWKDVEIENINGGKPSINLSGKTKILAKKLKVKKIFVTLSHSPRWAMAYVILES